MTDVAAWRGIAAEKVDDVSAPLAALLRRRSRLLLADLLRPHRRGVAWTLGAIVVASLAALAGPWLVGLAIDRGIPPILSSGDGTTLAWIAAAFAVTVAVQAVATRSFVTMTGRVGQSVVLELRRRVFWHMLRLPVAFHESYTSGRVISRQTSDIEAISALFEEGLDSLVSAVLTLLLVGTGMLLLDWRLALVVLAAFVPLTLLAGWFRRESELAYRRVREANSLVIVHFVETFGGLRAVQAFRRERRNQDIFDGLSSDYARASAWSSRLNALFASGITLVANLVIAVVLVYGGLLVIDGAMQLGVLASFLLYLQRFFDPLQDVSQFYNSFQGAASALEKLSGVLEEEPSVAEPAQPAPLPAPGGSEGDAGRRVRFESVRFAYLRQGREPGSAAKPVLAGFSLDIPAGQTVALVGETGAGKTTVARLMARFYDPVDGRVTLDGVDLRDLPDATLRREVVLITQESFLFDGTVADNIRLGRPAASDAEVEEAARAIGAHSFIADLPRGYATPVGKRGGRLSAGQRQLLSFARAFLAAPGVLVLDEATALLDIPSERLVQAALRTVLHGRTAVIIAHRLSTVAIADRVLVLRGGEIIEDGPPAELLGGDGEYADLHARWAASLALASWCAAEDGLASYGSQAGRQHIPHRNNVRRSTSGQYGPIMANGAYSRKSEQETVTEPPTSIGSSRLPSCRFCYPPEPWRIIRSSPNFRVQMGLGPLAEGYVLILSSTHYSCCAELPDSHMAEFGLLIRAVREAQTRLYGESLMFEHGRSAACLPAGYGEDLCYHAHLHLLPATVNLADPISGDFPAMTLDGWAAVRGRYAITGRPYLLAERDGSIVYAETPDRIRSRYLRRIAAAALGKPELEDWMAFPSYPVVATGRDKMAVELTRIIEESRLDGTANSPEGIAV